jgi:type VI secretion system protein ImpF
MSRLQLQQGMMPSILDRLIDPDSMGTASRPGYGLQQMIDSVRSDLEDLLNTRQPIGKLGEDFAETQSSVVAYGFPDLTSFNVATKQQRASIGRVFEEIIARFEPRLKNVRVEMAEGGKGEEHRVRFHINAHLAVDPAPEVGFETVLELSTGRSSIKQRAVT